MVHFFPSRFLKVNSKKLHTKSTGPFQIFHHLRTNVYFLNLHENLTINPIFNVIDLHPYSGIIEPPILSSDVSTSTLGVPTPQIPHIQHLRNKEIVDVIED